MSSNDGKNTVVTPLFSNVFQLNAKKEATPAPKKPSVPAKAPKSSRVLKAEDLIQGSLKGVSLSSFSAPKFSKSGAPTGDSVESLKHSLSTLTELHARLKFALTELEETILK